MNIVNILLHNINRKIKINFNGGDFSSEFDILLLHDFASKRELEQLLEHDFSIFTVNEV